LGRTEGVGRKSMVFSASIHSLITPPTTDCVMRKRRIRSPKGPAPDSKGSRGMERGQYVRIAQKLRQEDHCDWIPCQDCGGQGIAHCCDGICEQPNVEPLNEPLVRPPSPWTKSFGGS
jgi:hypothetical protein